MGAETLDGIQHWTRAMEKQCEHRVHIVMSNPRFLKVFQEFGIEVFRRSSIFHGLEDFLRLNEVRGKVCFEVGTWNGLTASVLSQFFDEVVSVDIAHNPMKREILDFLGIKNVRCIDIKNNAEKKNVLPKRFDCAFLDGNHAEDTETDFDLVKHCGRVIFHEVWRFQSPVWTLVHRLPMEEIRFGGTCFAKWEKKK